MTMQAEQHSLRRIVVTLDTSESGRNVLETAVRLAHILGAELEGVFVEDINLIRLTELPFVRELRPHTRAEEALSSQRMQKQLHILARRAERMFEQTVSNTGVSWSFRVWRGRTQAESLITVFEADILGLGQPSQVMHRIARPASAVQRKSIPKTPDTVNVLFSDSEQSARALVTGCHLAKDIGGKLRIVLTQKDTEADQQIIAKANGILDTCAFTANIVFLPNMEIQGLVRLLTSNGNRVLIADTEHPLIQQQGLDRCLEILPCPLLIVR